MSRWVLFFVALVCQRTGPLAVAACNVPIFGQVECHPERSVGCIQARVLAIPTFDNGSFTSVPRVFQNAESCVCRDGFTGVQCEQQCPMAPMYVFTRSNPASFKPCRHKHIQLPFLPAESCGQVFRHQPDCRGCTAEEERLHHQKWIDTSRYWALAGRCNCEYPHLGSACEWSINRKGSLPI